MSQDERRRLIYHTPTGTQKCQRCHVVKPLTAFAPRKNGPGLTKKCKPCQNAADEYRISKQREKKAKQKREKENCSPNHETPNEPDLNHNNPDLDDDGSESEDESWEDYRPVGEMDFDTFISTLEQVRNQKFHFDAFVSFPEDDPLFERTSHDRANDISRLIWENLQYRWM